MRDPATRPAPGDQAMGAWGVMRVAWVSEGLAHTIVGLEDDKGCQWTVTYRDWQDLVLEADLISPAGEHQ